MATIIVSFENEQEAKNAIDRLVEAEVGEVRARVLDSSEQMDRPNEGGSGAMISPELGAIDVRASEIPQVPQAEHDDIHAISSAIPVTGGQRRGVQVLIEVDDSNEEAVRRIIAQRG